MPDVTGIIISKSVKFRIEFLPHANWTPSSPHPTNSPMSRRQGSAMSGRGGPASPNPSIRSSNGMGSVSTSMTMVQEKGALSAFKAVYGRIRAEWRWVHDVTDTLRNRLAETRLDSLKSPALGSNSRFSNNSPMASPALGDNGGVWA